MRLLVAVLTLFGSLAFADSTAAAQCLNSLRSALIEGGFSGSLDCERDRISIKYIGEVQKFGRTFQVYDYRCRLQPVCPDCAIHGGQRIIFLERGRYVGQYKPNLVRVITRHGELVLVPTRSDFGPAIVSFTQDGPPKQLWVDGDVINFFR